jgi:hypothetical protein
MSSVEMDLLHEGLQLEAKHGKYWVTTVTAGWPRDPEWRKTATMRPTWTPPCCCG